MNLVRGGMGLAQVVEFLPSTHEALESNPSTVQIGVVVHSWKPSTQKVEAGG